MDLNVQLACCTTAVHSYFITFNLKLAQYQWYSLPSFQDFFSVLALFTSSWRSSIIPV